MKTVYGLIGHPLGHSFSKDYFTEKFRREGLDCEYENFDIDDIALVLDLATPRVIASSACRAKQSNLHCLGGFNVTIPYKESIIPYLDELDPIAAEVGAVNTVKVLDDGKMIGYNTDVIGVETSLRSVETPYYDVSTMAIVLGTGGASKAVQYVLRKNNIPYKTVSRSKEKGDLTYQGLNPEIIQSHLLIVNATPVGMVPNINDAPRLPYEAITPDHTLFDLIYNPEETLFLKYGREHGAKTINGLTMLHAQAEASWEIWKKI